MRCVGRSRRPLHRSWDIMHGASALSSSWNILDLLDRQRLFSFLGGHGQEKSREGKKAAFPLRRGTMPKSLN